MCGPWSWGRVLLVLGLGILALALVAGAVLLKVAELSYQDMKSTQGANERAVVSELRQLLAARPKGGPPRPLAEAASGYKRRLHLGAAGRFAYVAVPLEPHSSGRSSFCADAGGLVRFSLEGEEPAVEDGTCPASWLILSDGVPAPTW